MIADKITRGIPARGGITVVRIHLKGQRVSIGALRNWALQLVSRAITSYAQDELGNSFKSDIICHFDSDDYSAPTRISDQVKLLQESGKQAVGFREMLFWRSAEAPHAIGEEPDTWNGGQAWLYRNTDPRYILGTSLCYWRKAWESKPFSGLHDW